MFPFYQKLGADVPPKQVNDHKVLMTLIDKLAQTATDLSSITEKDPNSEEGEILQINMESLLQMRNLLH